MTRIAVVLRSVDVVFEYSVIHNTIMLQRQVVSAYLPAIMTYTRNSGRDAVVGETPHFWVWWVLAVLLEITVHVFVQ